MTDLPTERASVVDAAFALQMAAILLRDIASAMPHEARTSMPDDIRERLMATYYQDSFNALPVDIRDAARALVDADPYVQAAWRIHEERG